MSQRKTAEIMEAHMRKYEASGQTAIVYCNKHKLSQATFYYWRKKLSQVQEDQDIQFREIKLNPDIYTLVIRVQYTNGVNVLIEGEVSPSYIRELAGC
ncbi:MAG: hypothetical protein WBB31_17290 [Saprospiraceae bacterium]